jgi:hypothetical protein
MNPYTDTKGLKKRGKNPKFCIACFRVRKRVKVDEYHVCLDCRRGSTGMPRRLRAVTLKNGKTYFVDDRLRELRNIHNPCDRIDFEDLMLHKMDLLNW